MLAAFLCFLFAQTLLNLSMKKKLVILSGAGISAESGVATFRDSGGLWEGHNVMDVASPEGWRKNPALVLDFYNKRRRQLFEVQPNKAHLIAAELETDFDVTIITQNVDDLHERAGSTNVIHLHGELLKARSVYNDTDIIDFTGDINTGDLHTDGHQLRPHIVWFGEAVPAIENALPVIEQADYVIVIGTSLQVYPAAGLMDFAKRTTPIFYIDPNPAHIPNMRNPLEVFPLVASEGMELVAGRLKDSYNV
jgi:NAD-dependent deacetylase